MRVTHIEIIVEEPSMEELLRALLPPILDTISFSIYAHQGKDELLARLPSRMAGYAHWLPEDWRILVIVDRDRDECGELRNRMDRMIRRGGLRARTNRQRAGFQAASRLAIEELEAWYFGDWEAVVAAYPRASRTVPQKARFRNPDQIQSGTWEAFEREMQVVGYFQGGLRKIEAARAVGPHLKPERNRSPSFRALCRVLQEMTQ